MQNIFKKSTYLLFIIIFFITSCKTQQPKVHFSDLKYPKREFRGVWIHTIGQNQYKNMNPEQMRQYFTDMLDRFQSIGINVVVFQIRPQADAFYYSEIEPWSRYLTGVQGKAPEGNFDPLAFMVQECHKRNIELHAWLNPYRVTSAEGQQLAKNHIYNSRPELFVKYGSQTYFDPGIPENRQYICKVVRDIVKRYDVDAIHMDDYFYPYPIAGQNFPDDDSFQKYASSQGFKANQRNDWRRNNVNLLINELHDAIKGTKPWVRFGISPFGIYRNKKSTSDGSGSDTNGLQNYDDLYADIKLWVKNNWIDYNVPQVYWEIGHKAADYNTLVDWWAKNNYGGHLYIGQDVKRTMDATNQAGETQLAEKYLKERSHPEITGNCFWNGYLLLENYKGISRELANNYQKYPALIPAYTQMHDKTPQEVKNLHEEFTATTHTLEWNMNEDKTGPETAQYYVVYRFENNERKNLEDATKIVSITRKNSIVLPYEGGKTKYEYVVTAVDRFHNESKGKNKKLKL